jgi:hypothetical protein
VVAQPVTSPVGLRTGGRHRKQALHRKEPVGHRVSYGQALSAVVALVVFVAMFALTGSGARWAVDDSARVVDASPRPAPVEWMPIAARPVSSLREKVNTRPPTPFPADDKGFLDSSARCQGAQPAFAIGRTKGSLVVICGERAGRYEYLGVRLSDAAVLRADAETRSAPGYFAHKSGVVYAVSPAELKVTTGRTVIKQEPMIEYREIRR